MVARMTLSQLIDEKSMAIQVLSLKKHPPLPCRASPPQVGRMASGARLARLKPRMPRARQSIEAVSVLHLLSLLVGEMPGRAEGGGLPSHIYLRLNGSRQKGQ